MGRRTLIGLIVMTALAICTLIPGTPVNNDPSPQATTAGIHLTPPAAHRVEAAAASPLRALVAIVVAIALAVTGMRVLRLDPSAERTRSSGSQLHARTRRRRGPPLLLRAS